jgi:chromosome segregation protein
MYLKRLEISGFKSFAAKTTLDFSPGNDGGGITAVVGPNGSGKSNIADAIRWVIGEQSFKNLRGKKSEDVIFAGSGTKARLGSASVAIHFDNTDKRMPIEFSEVTVARKVFRSGESEYSMNGARVRLTDVIDLLARVGIGKDSYCVITQGMSDAMLAATPLERRGIFEDAAGVKPYQLQKERSLRKLESTRNNVERVEGLMLEIEPHLKHLKRQAEKASQGKIVAESLRDKQLRLCGFLWRRFEADRSDLVRERDVMTAKITEVEAELATIAREFSAETNRDQNATTIDAIEKRLRDTRIEYHGVERESALIDGRIAAEKERRLPKKMTQSTPVDARYVRAKLAALRQDQTALIERLGSVKRMAELRELQVWAKAIETRMAELYDDAGRGVVVTIETVSLPEDEMRASDERLAQLHTRRERLLRDRTTFEASLKADEEALSEEREKSRLHRERFFASERMSRLKQHELDTLKDALNESRVRLAKVEVREEDLTARIRSELACAPNDVPVYEGADMEKDKEERDIARLKVELEHIGGIDPLVVDEYHETQKRYAFLARESTDLRQAMAALRGIAEEMDRKIAEAFESAFREIAHAFAQYFALIFDGGKAELSKVKIVAPCRDALGVDERDALTDDERFAGESDTRAISGFGVEIAVCPPGKKISHLSMLSGGERSLTSLALLFAIIAHNPPPFAVLDEVEAALDESNSRRFGRVLRELSHKTQFIAMTHNRETMRQANALYGVTMGEDGVSEVLSVRLDQTDDIRSTEQK